MSINAKMANMGDDDMRKDLDRIQLQMNATTDESLESTRRMLMLCEESQDAGSKTLAMLDTQGEQLNRIEEGMVQINEGMKEAEKNLEGLEKCCGLCILPWKRRPKFEINDSYSSAGKGNEDRKVSSSASTTIANQGQVPQGGFITRITNDAREDEMEENMVGISGMIGNMRNMAVTMNNELDKQNSQIVRINIAAEALDDRVKAANKRADDILKQ